MSDNFPYASSHAQHASDVLSELHNNHEKLSSVQIQTAAAVAQAHATTALAMTLADIETSGTDFSGRLRFVMEPGS